MTKSIFLVFIGGGLGSVFRFLLSLASSKIFSHPFPVSTLTINILGSFLIGILSISLPSLQIHHDLRHFLVIGFCGGFTTFSAFSLESLHLFKNGEIVHFLTYIISSVILCIVFVWLGIILGEFIIKR